ncbi:unnamed protein product [Fusarium equiseti]|uniref:F-box domain-containing protein n=1 Tax=Fusarium equiseti TaxID=61235 RepID=A0A8J2J051_FUSEQ|nr:unnamed protein product [Fusarium equiseti]
MSFNKLPPETLLEIGQHVNQEDLRKLSSTCRRFMAVFQKKAYSTLDFDETSKSADRVLAVALGPRKQLVRTIRFVPHDPRPHEDETPDQGIKLSDKARQVLGSLHKFPELYKFQFDCSTWRMDQWGPVPFRLFIDKQPAQLTDFEVPAYPVRLWRGQDKEEWQRLKAISGFELLADTRKDEMRRFVVADVTGMCGKIKPVESLIGSSSRHVDEAELHESDLIPLWEEVSRLVQRNRYPARP